MSPLTARTELAGPDEGSLRRLLVLATLVGWALGTAHLADHVIRGELVVRHGLDPTWDHSGWPFQPEALAAGIPLAMLVNFVHFVPGHQTDTPAVIFSSYHQALPTWWGVALGGLAVTFTVALVAAVVLIAWSAVRVRQRSRRWCDAPRGPATTPAGNASGSHRPGGPP